MWSSSPSYSDGVKRQLRVEAEGIKQSSQQSKLINNVDEKQQDISFDIVIPSSTVDDSLRSILSLTGDILGIPLANLDKLIQMPTGCGEQNMRKY